MADMNLRESMKLVDINGKSYRVRKMPPWTATYLVKFVAAKVLPMLSVSDYLQESKPVNNVLADTPENDKERQEQEQKEQESRDKMLQMLTEELPKILDTITEEELKELMVKCLQYVDAMYLPAGPQPLMSKHGSFGLPDIEYDFPLLIKAIVEEIKFNVSGFFGEGGFSIADLTGTTLRSKQ